MSSIGPSSLSLPTAVPSSPQSSLLDRFHQLDIKWKALFGLILLGGSGYLLRSLFSRGSNKTSPGQSKKPQKKVDPTADEVPSDDMTGNSSASDPSIDLLARPFESLTPQQRAEVASAEKRKGNKYYMSGRYYDKAIACYSNAIKYSDPGDEQCAVYYANRAACYMAQAQYDKVLEDCNAALELQPTYIKALMRRASAYEKCEPPNLSAALDDYVEVCLRESYQSKTSVEAMERTVREVGKRIYAEEAAGQTGDGFRLPSRYVIGVCLNSFEGYPLVDPSKSVDDWTALITSSRELEANKDDQTSEVLGTSLFGRGLAHLAAGSYEAAKEDFAASAELTSSHLSRALNMFGFFKYMMGDIAGAEKLFLHSLDIDPDNYQSQLKLASLLLERGAVDEAEARFEKAVALGGLNRPDFYLHRAQLHLHKEAIVAAIADFKKGISLDTKGNVPFLHAQLAITEFRSGSFEPALNSIRRATELFPDNSMILNTYGELLLEMGKVVEAEELFDKALERDPSSPMTYVSKATVAMHVKGDLVEAKRLLTECLRIDPAFDMAYQHLGQLAQGQQRFDEAIEAFDKAAKLQRLEMEKTNTLCMREVCKAMKKAVAKGVQLPRQA